MVMKERRLGGDEIREHLVMPAPKDFSNERWGNQSVGMVRDGGSNRTPRSRDRFDAFYRRSGRDR